VPLGLLDCTIEQRIDARDGRAANEGPQQRHRLGFAADERQIELQVVARPCPA
jgi:hypothetical protein